MCCETNISGNWFQIKIISYMNDNRNDNGMQSINYNWISRYEISVIVIHWYIYIFIYRDRCLDKKPRRPEYNSLTPNAYPLYLITLHIKWNRTNSIFIHNINQWLIKKNCFYKCNSIGSLTLTIFIQTLTSGYSLQLSMLPFCIFSLNPCANMEQQVKVRHIEDSYYWVSQLVDILSRRR